MGPEGCELNHLLTESKPSEAGGGTSRETAPEEFFVPAQETEPAAHAPAGLDNPFWSA